MDYLIHSTVCKHIHLVNIHQSPSTEHHFELQEALLLPSSGDSLSHDAHSDDLEVQESNEINGSIIVDMPTVDTFSVDYLSS